MFVLSMPWRPLRPVRWPHYASNKAPDFGSLNMHVCAYVHAYGFRFVLGIFCAFPHI